MTSPSCPIRPVRSAGQSSSDVRAPVDPAQTGPAQALTIKKMLELADRSEIDYVLGTEVSRLNRGEAFNFSLIRHELEQCGVRLEFLDQTLRTALGPLDNPARSAPAAQPTTHVISGPTHTARGALDVALDSRYYASVPMNLR